MNISVIGTGYVGLTTGISLAYIGHYVTCVDIDANKIEGLKRGKLPIHENHLAGIFALARERMHFTVSLEDSVNGAEVIILAIGTPAKDDGAPDLSYLYEALDQTLAQLKSKQTPTLIVNKSTVPVGTCNRIAARVAACGLEQLVNVASNPEFLRQGRAVYDTLYPERIVVGGQPEACDKLKEMYSPLIQQSFEAPTFLPRPDQSNPVPFLAVDLRSAELSKYAANAFLAMKISFINEIANVCDRVGANVTDIASIIGTDSRIGPAFLNAGIGYGGSCFPKDTRALHFVADANGYDFKLLSAVIEVNRNQKYVLINKLRSALHDLRGRKIAVLGLTFKPGTDDLREAPSFPIIQALLGEGAIVSVHDPIALEKARPLLPMTVQTESDLTDALRGADAALLVTEWPEYLALNGQQLASVMRRPLFIDGRNALPIGQRENLDYLGIGIGSIPAKVPV